MAQVGNHAFSTYSEHDCICLRAHCFTAEEVEEVTTTTAPQILARGELSSTEELLIMVLLLKNEAFARVYKANIIRDKGCRCLFLTEAKALA